MHARVPLAPLALSLSLVLAGCSDETIASCLLGGPPSAAESEASMDPDGAYEPDAEDEPVAPSQPVQVAAPARLAPPPAKPEPTPAPPAEPKPSPPRPRPQPPEASAAPAPSAAAPARAAVDVLALDLRGQTAIDAVYVARGVGKSVYPIVNKTLQRRDRKDRTDPPTVYAGEKLTLVEAIPFNREGQPLEYNFVTVRRADGSEGNLQIRYLSATPLNFDLSKPGDAKALVRGVYLEGVRAGVELHRTLSPYAYDIPRDPPEVYAKAYGRRQVYEEGLNFAKHLAASLSRGAHTSSREILRNPLLRWAALAEDPRVLSYYEGGVDDPELLERCKQADSLLSNLSNLSSHGFKLARVASRREARSWLRGTEGLPAKAVETLTQKELAKLDAEEQQVRERMIQTLTRAGELYAEVFGAPR